MFSVLPALFLSVPGPELIFLHFPKFFLTIPNFFAALCRNYKRFLLISWLLFWTPWRVFIYSSHIWQWARFPRTFSSVSENYKRVISWWNEKWALGMLEEMIDLAFSRGPKLICLFSAVWACNKYITSYLWSCLLYVKWVPNHTWCS